MPTKPAIFTAFAARNLSSMCVPPLNQEAYSMSLQKYFKGTYGTMYYVKDMAKSVNFYKERFGFKTRMESPDWTEIEMPNGQAICLHKADAKMKALPGGIM